jgi:branched-chain amino acid transport system substrate-binding protein
LSDVNAAGLDVAHGLTFMQSWYWDLDDKTRDFAKRFYARRGRMPNDNQVAVYSSVAIISKPSPRLERTTPGRS